MRKTLDATSYMIPKSGTFSQGSYSRSLITSKPNVSQSNSQQRDTVTWGLHKNENVFETTYGSQYANSRSSKIAKRVVDDPIIPETTLGASLIPHENPMFVKGKKTIEPLYMKNIKILEDEAPKSGRKQFMDLKHKTFSDSDTINSARAHRNRSPIDRAESPPKSARDLHLSSFRVHEAIHSEPADFSCDHSLFNQTLNSSTAAGVSDFKNILSPSKSGKKKFVDPSEQSPIKNILANSFLNTDNPNQTKKETQLTTDGFGANFLKLRTKQLKKNCRSTSPISARLDISQDNCTEQTKTKTTPVKPLAMQNLSNRIKASVPSTFRSKGNTSIFEETAANTARDTSPITTNRKLNNEHDNSKVNVFNIDDRISSCQTDRSSRTNVFISTSEKKPTNKSTIKSNLFKQTKLKQGMFSNVNKLYATLKK